MSSGVQLVLDEVEAIARQLKGQIRDDAQQGAGAFADATLSPDAFAGIPPGLAFHAQQQAAHQVFVETVNGVVADLEQFGETLEANVASHRKVDESNADTMSRMEVERVDRESAAAALTDLNEQYAGQDAGFEGEQAYDEGREGNEALDVDVSQDAGPAAEGDSGVDAPDAAPATGPVSTPGAGADLGAGSGQAPGGSGPSVYRPE